MSPVDSPQSISQIELIFGQSVQINQDKSISTNQSGPKLNISQSFHIYRPDDETYG